MQVALPTEKSSETKLKFLAFLLILEEYVAELDAIINGPAAYGHKPLVLSQRDWEYFMSIMLDQPPPNEALISAFKKYGSSKE